MTEEEREKAQEQLKALNQAYHELSQHCSDQNNSAEEVGLLAFPALRKQRYLLFSCMTNSFPSAQRQQPCPCLFTVLFFLLPHPGSEQEPFKQLREIPVCCKHAFLCQPLVLNVV